MLLKIPGETSTKLQSMREKDEIDGAQITSKSDASKQLSKPLPLAHVSPEKSMESSRNVNFVSPSSSSTSKASSSSSLYDGSDLSSKTVIFSNVFDQNQCKAKYYEELKEKCLEYGKVDQFNVYTTHPDGIVKVLFRTRAAASYAILMMDGENFGNRILKATEWNEESSFDESSFVEMNENSSEMPERSPEPASSAPASPKSVTDLNFSISSQPSPICSYENNRETNVLAKHEQIDKPVQEKKNLLKEFEKRQKEAKKRERDAKKKVYVPILWISAFFFYLQTKGAQLTIH